MSVPKWLNGYMKADDLGRISDAVKKAEQKTCGELVPVIVHRSSTVGHIPLILTLLFAAVILALDVSIGSDWHFTGLIYWPLAFVVVFALAGFVSQIDFIERWLTPKEDQASQVMRRAQLEFYEARMQHTEKATGILLFISMMEHRAVVLADKGIAEKIPPETWAEVVQLMIQGIKQDRLTEGFIEAIERCGKILEEKFPKEQDNENELPNALVIKE